MPIKKQPKIRNKDRNKLRSKGRTKEYIMVNENYYANTTVAVMSAIIATLLCTGFTSMFTTAYEFGFGIWSVLLVSAIASTVFAVIFYQNKKWLTAAALIGTPVLMAAAFYFDIFNIKTGANAMFYTLQHYAFFFLPDIFDGGSSSDGVYIEGFLNAYNIIAICFTTHALIRRKNIPWTLLFFAPVFVMAAENTSMVPKPSACIIAATGVLLLVLAHSMRNKEANATGKMLLILAIPVLLFTIIVGVIFPEKKYDKYELATDFLNSAREKAEEISGSLSEKFDIAINGINNPNIGKDNSFLFSFMPASTNLKNVGPFDPKEEAVMKVRRIRNTDYQGTYDVYSSTALYLKIESLDEYKDNMLRSTKIKTKVYKDGYEPDPVEAPFKVQIEPLNNKWVDIVPYYTDFYVVGNKKYQTVNPYNTTKDGATVYPYCPVPVKTGNIYTDEYIEDYVYGTNLKVPKATEMAIISSGDLPDWYLDVYHGYVTMSDAEKVRRVTTYVSQLHPYNKNTDYPPNGVDFVAWFISDAQTGICVHYAATTVILLRMIGVPARYVRGYVDSMAYANTENYIYSTQAHAWFEFFVPEYGWIMGDSTPGAYVEAGDFDINGVAAEYPEINQAQFARGYTSIYNPDYTEPTTTETTETTETSATTSESETEATTETTPETTPEETTSETEQGATPTPAEPTKPDIRITTSSSSTPEGEDVQKLTVIGGDLPDNTNVYMGPDGILYFEIGENRLVKAVGTVILTISLIAFVIDLLLIGWVVYWRLQFAKKDPNEKAIAGYHYFSFMSRLFKYGLPRRARLIAEKAAFAADKITPQEAEALIKVCYVDMAEISKGFNRFKKLLYKALEVKVTGK